MEPPLSVTVLLNSSISWCPYSQTCILRAQFFHSGPHYRLANDGTHAWFPAANVFYEFCQAVYTLTLLLLFSVMPKMDFAFTAIKVLFFHYLLSTGSQLVCAHIYGDVMAVVKV